jgi:protein-disulfide isomerase
MKSETKLFLGIIIGTIVIIGTGIALLSRSTTENPTKVDPSLLVRADSNKISTSSATVTLVEFSDFQCPACGAYYPVVKQVLAEFKDNITFVYRNFPLTNIHQNAQLAAQSAEAAGRQGKYWEMHDMLFTKQSEWSAANARDLFTQYAGTLGINVDQFKKDIDSDYVKKKIDADVNDGTTLGVNATPTFYLNSEKIENPASLEDFKTLIKAAILKAPKPTIETAYHAHFNLKIYVNGVTVDLSQEKYQSTEGKELDENIHVHDGNGDIVHIHKKGVVLGEFFTSIGMKLSKDTFKLFVNGKENTAFLDYMPQDLDRIVITDSKNTTAIQQEIVSVADTACIYSEKCPERGKPPTEACVGGLGTGCEE